MAQILRHETSIAGGVAKPRRRGVAQRVRGDALLVLDAATREPVTGAFSMLGRADQGITSKVRTRARLGHAHTLWYAIFNAPQNCSGGLCEDDDIFNDPSDHSAGFNAQIAATRA